MKVVALIPTMLKNAGYLYLCVESLLATTDWEIIICENGTSYEDVPKFSNDKRVRFIHRSKQGQCGAVNIMAELVHDADYLFISNDDMYYAPDWNKHLKFQHPCFSPNLVEPTDNAGSAPPFVKFQGGYTLGAFKQKKVNIFVKDLVNGPVVPKVETGFNFPVFIKKNLWDLIGGYDEKYDPWGSNSDTDLQTKIDLAGVQPMRLRNVLVYHFSNKSGTFDGTHQDAWWENWNYYKSKWGFTRDDEPIPDTWYARDLVNKEKNIYHPDWEGKYYSSIMPKRDNKGRFLKVKK